MSGQEFEGGADEVEAYAAEVRAELADLSADDSAELLEDLEDHLREVAAEDAGVLRERLGEPAAYARELRESAGLPPKGEGAVGAGTGATGARRGFGEAFRDAGAAIEAKVRSRRAGREVLDYLPSLRPAWWVLRAWLAVRLLGLMTTNSDWTSQDFALIPRVGGNLLLGVILLVIAVPGSVRLGRRGIAGAWSRRGLVVGQGVLAVFAIVLAAHSLSETRQESVSPAGWDAPVGVWNNGIPVNDIFAYTVDGKLIDHVYLYDQQGRPIEAGPIKGGPLDEYSYVDQNGMPVTNLYPLRQGRVVYLPDGSQSAAPPPIVVVPQGIHRLDESPGPSAVSSTQATPATPTPSGATPAQSASAPSAPPSTPAGTATTK